MGQGTWVGLATSRLLGHLSVHLPHRPGPGSILDVRAALYLGKSVASKSKGCIDRPGSPHSKGRKPCSVSPAFLACEMGSMILSSQAEGEDWPCPLLCQAEPPSLMPVPHTVPDGYPQCPMHRYCGPGERQSTERNMVRPSGRALSP